MSNAELARANGGASIMREGFGERSMETRGETHATALAEHAKAVVSARFIMALQRPRSWDDVRVKLLRECDRPGFAEVARYNKPVGKGIQGPSIRFAEACLRYAGNVETETETTFEDRYRRTMKIRVIDLETNTSYSAEITVEKTVERRALADRVMIAQRQNSAGDTVFIVESTEDELLNKQNALVSKAVRTLALRLIPGDIVDEAQDRCIETLKSKAAKDPDGERKKLCDAFASVGVMPGDLVAYLGHPLEQIQPAEMVNLRSVYAAIRDGESTWSAAVEAKNGATAQASGEPAKTGTAAVAERIGARRGRPTNAEREARAAASAAPASTTAAAVAPSATIPSPAPTSTEPKQTTLLPKCDVCGKDIVDGRQIFMYRPDGAAGGRHPACPAPPDPFRMGAAAQEPHDAEPPPGVLEGEGGRQPGED